MKELKLHLVRDKHNDYCDEMSTLMACRAFVARNYGYTPKKLTMWVIKKDPLIGGTYYVDTINDIYFIVEDRLVMVKYHKRYLSNFVRNYLMEGSMQMFIYKRGMYEIKRAM